MTAIAVRKTVANNKSNLLILDSVIINNKYLHSFTLHILVVGNVVTIDFIVMARDVFTMLVWMPDHNNIKYHLP